MQKIGLVLVVLAMVVGLGIALAPSHSQASGWAQLTMQNSTPYTLDLYVDGGYGCRALSGGFCTTQVTAEYHTFTAKTSDGSLSTNGAHYFEEGESATWTITYSEQ